jgi:hypothetical protein
MVLLGVIGEKSAMLRFYAPTIFPFVVSTVSPAGLLDAVPVVFDASFIGGTRAGGLLVENLVSLS